MKRAAFITTTVLATAMLVAPVVTLPQAGGVAPSVTSLPLSSARAQTVVEDVTQPGAPLEVSEVVRTSTDPFDLVAVTWQADPDGPAPDVEVRVREADGWSAWETLAVMDEGPDPGTEEFARARTGTSPLLTDHADGVEVRLSAEPGQTPVGATVELVGAGTSTGDTHVDQAPLASASAAVSRPAIISRAAWGADESLRGGAASYSSSVDVAVIHHTASTNAYSDTDAAAQIRSIYAYHTASLGWNDIGYNFLVDRFGRIYEGRAGGVERAVTGAHTGGFNARTVGISALGNYQETSAPGALTEAVSQLIAWKLPLHDSDPAGTTELTSAGGGTSRYAAGSQVTVPNVIGHRDVGLTACPGINLYTQLGNIRSRASALAGPIFQTAGSLDAVTGGYQNVTVRGWALRVADLTARSVTVKVAGTDRGTVLANASRPDVASAYPSNSANHGFSGAVASPTGIVPVCPRVSEGLIRLTLPCRSVAVLGPDPFGSLDEVRSGFGALSVRGWVVDGDTTGPVDVHVYVDGAPIGVGTASSARSDLTGLLPGRNPGFSFTLPYAGGGTHQVCTYGISTGGTGVNSMLGCRTVSLDSSPTGSLDTALGGGGAIDLRGWVIDPDAQASPVHVYVDGAYRGTSSSTQARGDVATAFPAYASRPPGYETTLTAGPGAHRVCTYGINTGSGDNRLLGCQGVTLATGSPFGWQDGVVGVGNRAVRGWVADPDVRGAVALHVYVDGRFVASGTTGVSRPDVERAFPRHGVNRGYEVSIGSTTGRRVCVYGIDDSGRAENTTLGCSDL